MSYRIFNASARAEFPAMSNVSKWTNSSAIGRSAQELEPSVRIRTQPIALTFSATRRCIAPPATSHIAAGSPVMMPPYPCLVPRVLPRGPTCAVAYLKPQFPLTSAAIQLLHGCSAHPGVDHENIASRRFIVAFVRYLHHARERKLVQQPEQQHHVQCRLREKSDAGRIARAV